MTDATKTALREMRLRLAAEIQHINVLGADIDGDEINALARVQGNIEAAALLLYRLAA